MSETAQRDPNYVTTIMGVAMDLPHAATAVYVDEVTHRLLVNATLTGVSITTPSAVINGHKTVVTPGSALSLATTTTINAVVVQGLAANIGNVYVGSSSVSSSNGFELQPGQSTGIAIDDIAKVFVDAANATDGVSFIGG